MVIHRNLSRGPPMPVHGSSSRVPRRERLEIRPGLRGDHFGLSDQWTLDPRIAMTAQLPKASR